MVRPEAWDLLSFSGALDLGQLHRVFPRDGRVRFPVGVGPDGDRFETMNILSHRGNLFGKEPSVENTLAQMQRALGLGFGLETDIRWDSDRGFYISHDPMPFTAAGDAVRHAELWRRHPDQLVALNIKELGYEQRLVDFLDQTDTASRVFLFDMELLEAKPGATAGLYARLGPHVRRAARVSDRNEPVAAAVANRGVDIVWLDEFDGNWARADDVARLHDAGKSVYAVSPELHGRSLADAQARWDDFIRWGIAGVCTDYPVACREHLAGARPRAVMGKEVACNASN